MIDILHPAHVHFYRTFFKEMNGRGHQLLITAREKDHSTDLLERLGLPHERLSVAAQGLSRQILELLHRTVRFYRLARRFEPDVLTGVMGPTIVLAGRLGGWPSWVFYDTEFATASNSWIFPLASRVFTPSCYQAKVRGNHTSYNGYHQLTFLHPNRFRASADEVRRAGLDPDKPYAVVRFVAFQASHDRGELALTHQQKVEVIETLRSRLHVYVTSEGPLPHPLEPFRYRGHLESIHHVLGHATLYYGESATMAAEAAVLGVPAVYIARTARGFLEDQSRHGAVSIFRPGQFRESLERALSLAGEFSTRSGYWREERRLRLLAGKVDVTEFMVNEFERCFG